MRKKLFYRFIVFFFLFTSFFLFSSCEKKRENKSEEKSIRVISLSPALTELVCHLGQQDCLVARSTACDWPETIKQLPTAGNFADPETERILSLSPTLIISNDLVNPGAANVLRSAGITTEIMQCHTLKDYRAWVIRLGQLLNCPDAALSECERIDRMTASFESELHGASFSDVLYVIWGNPLMAAGAETLPDTLGQFAGLRNVITEEKGYLHVSLEYVMQKQPDVIVWLSEGESWKNQPAWSGIRAIQDGRVIVMETPSSVLRPGPRIFEGIQELKESLLKLKQKEQNPNSEP